MIYFLEKINSRNNNFDFLRFFAASLVIVSHSFPLSGSAFEPFFWLTGYDTFGGLALAIFFVMSGFLIAKSWIDNPDFLNFAKKRFLRIIPGLFFVILFSIFVIGPAVTALSLHEYFSSPQLIIYFKNVFMFPIYYGLPGVFAGNLYPNAVNGSIWTLPVEVIMYATVVLLGFMGVYKKKWLSISIALFLVFIDISVLPKMDVGSKLFLYQPIVPLIKLAVFFAIGLCFYVYREKVPFNKTIAILALAVWILSFRTQAAHFVGFFTLPYLIMYVSFLNLEWIKNFSKYGDFSYGIYIYAFPVQQTVMHYLQNKINIIEFFFISYCVTLVFAIISWNLIEKPFLNLKNKRIRKWLFEEKVVY